MASISAWVTSTTRGRSLLAAGTEKAEEITRRSLV